MADVLEPLRHHAYAVGDDELLRREADQHLSKLPQLQFMSELLAELRSLAPPWWSSEQLRDWWPASTRMGWLEQRADLRQAITTHLTGLPANAARKKTPSFQAELIDAVVDEGDVSAAHFEEAFEPAAMVVYGPAAEMWRAFRAQLPLDDDSPAQERLMAWILRALIVERGETTKGMRRRSVLTPLEVRTAIDGHVWHSAMPLEVRVAIDDARFRQERMRPGRPFLARHDLAIALPEQIAAHIPQEHLHGVLDLGEAAMGFTEAEEQVALPLSGSPPTRRIPMRSETRDLATGKPIGESPESLRPATAAAE
ncbi:MAG: hypothetical protein AAGA56_12020 [Myxococcota bacterium]